MLNLPAGSYTQVPTAAPPMSEDQPPRIPIKKIVIVASVILGVSILGVGIFFVVKKVSYKKNTTLSNPTKYGSFKNDLPSNEEDFINKGYLYSEQDIDLTVKEGKTAILDCKATQRDSKTLFRWKKGKAPLLYSPRFNIQEERPHDQTFPDHFEHHAQTSHKLPIARSKLIIKDVQLNDAGSYICTIEIPLKAQMTREFHLKVKPKTRFV